MAYRTRSPQERARTAHRIIEAMRAHTERHGHGWRSTSVGDVIVGPDGKKHLVMPFGFHCLEGV